MEQKIIIDEDAGAFIFNNGFLFDDNSIKIFTNVFFPIDIKLGNIKCPKCGHEDTNEYQDCFICFRCKFKRNYFKIRENYSLSIDNGYLCRINKKSKKIEYFHRFLMKEEIIKFHKQNPNFKEIEIQVHHIDHNKQNNSSYNLIVMDVYSHNEHHKDFSENKAFETWCYKSKGDIDYIYFDQFLDWKEKKEQGGYY